MSHQENMKEEQKQKLREEREQRFLKSFRAGDFLNPLTGGQNPFKIETWWNEEMNQALSEQREGIRDRLEVHRQHRHNGMDAYFELVEIINSLSDNTPRE